MALDFLRIFFFDGVILLGGNGIVFLTSKFIVNNDGIFHAARRVSDALFLLLYVIVVFFDIIEFFREQRLATSSVR